jgi:hypothetical protein
VQVRGALLSSIARRWGVLSDGVRGDAMRFGERQVAPRCRRLAESNGSGRADEGGMKSRDDCPLTTEKSLSLRHYVASGG